MNFSTPALTSPLYYRRVVYSSPVLHECVDISSPVQVLINSLPTGDLIAKYDTICEGDTLWVKFNAAGEHPPFLVTIDGKISDPFTTSPDSLDFEPPSTRFYTMQKIEDDSGCVADISNFIEKVNVKVYDVPDANAGDDDQICSDTYNLEAIKSDPEYRGVWSADGATFSDPTDPVTATTVDQYGPHLFTWTEYNWICKDVDDVEIIFYEQPDAADAGPDQVLDFSYTTQLEAAIPRIGTGKWTVVSGTGDFNNDTLPDAVIVELANSTTLKWTVHNGNCHGS